MVSGDNVKSELIFGYGSLINEDSLRGTVPNATNILPTYVVGFRREFNFHDAEGWTTDNFDLAGIPMCAVNVMPAKGNGRVNGVTFEVGEDYFEELKRREVGYRLIETTAHDFRTGEQIGKCSLFSCDAPDGEYLFDNPAQERYLEVCLKGAKQLGDVYLKEFLATTYIGDQALKELPDLLGDFG